MTELSGVPSFGGGGFVHHTAPAPEKPAIEPISQSAKSGTATDNKSEDRSNDARKLVQDISFADRISDRERVSPETLAGPTPAFQASLLEIESDLQNVIAKLEAARTRSRDEAATAPAVATNPSQPSVSVAPKAATIEANPLANASPAEATRTQALPEANPDAASRETPAPAPKDAPEIKVLDTSQVLQEQAKSSQPQQSEATPDSAKTGKVWALETPYDLGSASPTAPKPASPTQSGSHSGPSEQAA
ncbi:MAG: hypothetical protein ACJA2X_001119 [Halocynthiibacter sp.]|jgi:hypothetical protein